MKRILCVIALLFLVSKSFAQYEPGAFNYGLATMKSFGLSSEMGLGARMEYAPNCFTTYILEYNHLFSVDSAIAEARYNEVAFGVNLILFNWYPTTITGGISYVVNDSGIFKNIEDEASIAFRTGDFNHGVQIKIRALHQVSEPLHIFAEFNLKSLGRRYDTFLIGLNYDFNAR